MSLSQNPIFPNHGFQNNIPEKDILIVDDTVENLRLLSTMLSKQGYYVRKALNGKAALLAIETVAPDLVLLDIMMPEMDGFEVCQCLKANPATADIPVIFLSALNETFDKVKAFQLGGADFIAKPFHLEEVLTRVKNQLALREWAQEIRQLNAQLEQRVQERTQQLEYANQELVQEITERKRVQSQLLEMALHDALTGLPNRAFFMERLAAELKAAKSHSGYEFAVLFLDCDRFKVINDSLGHLLGDTLLIAVAHRLEATITHTDTLSRFGGDEFAILLPHVEDRDRPVQVANQILATLSAPFTIQGHEIVISASIGIVWGHSEYDQPEHVLRDADTAMYHAKGSGKACYQMFTSIMHEAALQLLNVETDLRRAIDNQELVLHYQPVVHLRSGVIDGFEALVRWQHPQQGLLMPGAFIPVAEETGLILPIGLWVLQTACHQLHDWQQAGVASSPLTMSVNLSVRQFTQSNLIQKIDRILAETQIDPRHLKLEITESVLMDKAASVSSILNQLQQRQIHLSIDDFGTGYSSLSYLHAFPINSLKIDRSFVQRLDESVDDLGLIPAIMGIARAMKLNVIAEGIETAQQLAQLRALDCTYGQGYFFAKPLTVHEASQLLSASPPW